MKHNCSLCKRESEIDFQIIKGQPEGGYMLVLCKNCEDQVQELLFQEFGWKG